MFGTLAVLLAGVLVLFGFGEALGASYRPLRDQALAYGDKR
jgi:hypothetical protein